MNLTPTGLTLGFFDIFQALTAEQRDEIAKKMSCRQYNAGEFIIPAPDDDGHVYFLISGQVRACAYNQTGKQVHFEDLQPGMMFGELAAIDSGERTSDCISTESSMVASLGKQAFLDLLEEYPSAKNQVLIRLVALVRLQLQRVYEYTSYTVNQRVRFELLRLMSEGGGGDPPIALKTVPTQSEIADRISSHREAVSRELTLLESEGLISRARGQLIINDPVLLTKRAQLN
ncbi:MAG: Crp/Fnr family transcriptional regulator [Granulosicoccus sp.]